ncbi:hypothetical protein [Paraglaciecola arctica]|uniref:hypothetical protein n=1 Tax=Paraglaciecola arctica TaxID=1128911 RepID=UPI001C070D31|nr:hypothetical protein [Paraglaciecola arctica]MBU3004273.1 hypothetical protein [Paraglaciecola arctica]
MSEEINLEFLSPRIDELRVIYEDIIVALSVKYGKDFAVIAFGSAVTGDFSLNPKSRFLTLSDIEVVVVSDIHIGQSKLEQISTEIGKKFFPFSPLFHVDIRETTPNDLLARKNLVPFESAKLLYGKFDIRLLTSSAKHCKFPAGEILDKGLIQYAIFNSNYNNLDVSTYLAIKLALILMKGLKIKLDEPNINNQLLEAKRNLNANTSNSMELDTSVKIIKQAIKKTNQTLFFTKEQRLRLINCGKSNIISVETMDKFLKYYYQESNPQINYFQNLFNYGFARKK